MRFVQRVSRIRETDAPRDARHGSTHHTPWTGTGAGRRRGRRVAAAGRSLRGFCDGFVAVLLPAYLLALGMSMLSVGLLSTSTLLGSAIAMMLVGNRFPYRSLLLVAAGVMVATGIGFSSISTLWPLLIVAFLGSMPPVRGMSACSCPRILEPFFTTGGHRGDTGLGLHIPHQIVTEVLGGLLHVESMVASEANGAASAASFTLHLPYRGRMRSLVRLVAGWQGCLERAAADGPRRTCIGAIHPGIHCSSWSDWIYSHYLALTAALHDPFA